MDVPAIATPIEIPEGEPKSGAPEEADAAFLQVLAGLGLLSTTAMESVHSTIDERDIRSDTPASSSWRSNEPKVFVGIAAEVALEPLAASAGAQEAGFSAPPAPQPTGNRAGPERMTGPDAVPAELISAEKTQAETASPDAAGQIPFGQKESGNGATVKVDAVSTSTAAVHDEVRLETLHSGQAGDQKADRSTVSRTMDRALPDRGPAFAILQASGTAMPSSTIQPSVEPLGLAKDTATATPTLWGAAIDPPEEANPGEEQQFASTDHGAWKGAFQRDADGQTSMPSSASTVFGIQAAPSAARSVSGPIPMPETPVVIPELPALPSSVRFEVHPGDLGRVRVQLSVVDHTVYTNVMTERPEMQEFLMKSTERLEAGLAAHGLEVGRFQVDVQGREHADRGGTAWSRQETDRHPPQADPERAVPWHPDERPSDREDHIVNLFA